jgi:hypothetical protein
MSAHTDSRPGGFGVRGASLLVAEVFDLERRNGAVE